MRHIREKIFNIQIVLYICLKIIPLKKPMTLLHYHHFLKILFLQVNFAQCTQRKDDTMTIGIMLSEITLQIRYSYH